MKRIIRQLKGMDIAGELPILVDNGGIFDDNGFFKDFINQIINEINQLRVMKQSWYCGIQRCK